MDDQQKHEKLLKITNYQKNANQNCNITSHLSAWLLSKSQEITSVGRDMEKKEPLWIVGKNVNQSSDYGKQVKKKNPHKHTKIELSHELAIPLLSN